MVGGKLVHREGHRAGRGRPGGGDVHRCGVRRECGGELVEIVLRVECVEGGPDCRVSSLDRLPGVVFDLMVDLACLELPDRDPFNVEHTRDDRVGIEPGGETSYVEEWYCHLRAFRSVRFLT